MGIRLSIARLTLTAPGALYDVHFRAGVNIIAGPISTGKSSVLALIDYALGSSSRPTYPEISKCSDVLVEFRIGEELLTVRRSLHSVNRKATLYGGGIADVLAKTVDGEDLSAVHDPSDRSISKELLRRLGLDNMKVKTAPTQAASDVSTFSLRDLMHFIYVDQDRIDSQKSAFFEQQPPLAIKWRAAFEILTGLYDEVATSLSASLSESQAEVSRHRQYYENVKLFLTRSQVPAADQLHAALAVASSDRALLDQRVTEARSATEVKQGEHLELVRRRDELAGRRAEIQAREAELGRSLRQLGKLQVQYARERAQLEFLKESESLIGSLPVVRCPACLQPTDADSSAPGAETATCHVCHRTIPETPAGVDVDRRLSSLRRRVSDLEAYIADLATLQSGLGDERQAIERQVAEIDATIRRLEPAAIFPEMRELMQLEAAIGLVEAKRRQLTEQLELREKADSELTTVAAIEARIRELAKELDERQRNRPSRDQVIDTFSRLFADVLREVRFPDLRSARVDGRSYIPVVRDQAYGELSSRGAIALAVAGWHLAALQYFLNEDALFPGLLLIDSPLSNVGHDAADKEFRDQQIVDAFYGLLMRLHEERSDQFQMILCDNRPPYGADPLVAMRFTGDPKRGRYGLIADEIVESQERSAAAISSEDNDGVGTEDDGPAERNDDN